MSDSEVCTKNNKFVYLDLNIGEDKAGRVIIELYTDIVPKAVENFRGLCTGEYGKTKNDVKLHYKGTSFHRVLPQFMVQGGDIEENCSSQLSIYGKPFEDENYILKHTIEGTVGMANLGPNTNSTQFYITTCPCPHLDDMNVVIGYVRKGMNVIKEISNVERKDDIPLTKCTIVNCGEISSGEVINLSDDDGTEDVYPPWPDDYDFPPAHNGLDIIKKIKAAGNHFYYARNYIMSEYKYKKMLRYIQWMSKKKELEHDCDELNKIQIEALLNLAASKLQNQKYKDVVKICTQVIQKEPRQCKAHFRRAEAKLRLYEYTSAVRDFKKALEIMPNDKIILRSYRNAKMHYRKYLEEEKKRYSKMLRLT